MSRPGTTKRTRPYRLKARAQQQSNTRRRIADAAVELHGSIGPARTTISAIAERAGVERLTVYRHFPDDRALFAACSGRFLEQHPPPDLVGPMTTAAPPDRLAAVLLPLYRYYRENEPMMTALVRDAATVPLVGEYLEPYIAMLSELAQALSSALARPASHGAVRAAVGYALAFSTWRSLALEQALSDSETVDLMSIFVVACRQRATPGRPRRHRSVG